jgi:hypothetical protein
VASGSNYVADYGTAVEHRSTTAIQRPAASASTNMFKCIRTLPMEVTGIIAMNAEQSRPCHRQLVHDRKQLDYSQVLAAAMSSAVTFVNLRGKRHLTLRWWCQAGKISCCAVESFNIRS